MASIQAKLIQKFFKIMRVNKMLAKQGDEFDKLLKKYEKKQTVKIPYKKMNRAYDFKEYTIDNMKCYVTKRQKSKPKKAVLYLFGGGYILPPDPGDFVLCGQMADHVDVEVWFPLYPMAPKHRLIETVKSTLAVYQEMLKTYSAKDIRFFGTSSGGSLCLSILLYIKHEQINIEMPEKLVLQSPGLQVPASPKQKIAMEKIAPKDCMIPPCFFDSIAPVLARSGEEYLLSPLLNDLSGFPKIDIFYGENEVMYAYLDDMIRVCKRDNVNLNFHIGKDMMHCWGAMEFVPEAREVRKKYFELLK